MGGGPQVTIRRVVRPGLESRVARAEGSCDTRSVVGPASSIEFRPIRLVPFLAHGHLACGDRLFHRAGAKHRPDPSEKSPRLGARSDTAARAAFSPVRPRPITNDWRSKRLPEPAHPRLRGKHHVRRSPPSPTVDVGSK